MTSPDKPTLPRYVPKTAHGYKRLMQGLDTWTNQNGFVVLRCHYTADPRKRTAEWVQKTRQGMEDPDQWDSEMEISFKSVAGISTFRPFTIPTHMTELSFNQELESARSWDFGYKKPAVGWFQVDGNNRVYWLDLMFGKDMAAVLLTTDSLCRKVKQHEKAMKYGLFSADYADIAGNTQTSMTTDTDYKILMRNGFHSLPTI